MKTKLIIIIVFLGTSFGFAQTKVADKFFKNYAYLRAAELYEKAIENGDDSEHVLTRLGDCYYNNSNSEKAVLWYGKALEKYEKKINPEYIYKYIQSLKSVGQYEQANTWLKAYKEIQGDDNKDLDLFSIEKYQELASQERASVIIKNLELNTNLSDFGGYIHGDQFIFATAKSDSKKKYKWNDEPFLDIYQGAITYNDEKIPVIENIEDIPSEDINTDYHEATVAVSNDGKTLYFTRDNVNKRNKLSYDKKGTSHLKIYKADFLGDGWGNIVELPINDNVHSSGHPALSPDNKTLYFVSDREGGYGQTDIYKVAIAEDGTFGEVENLGPTINTEGREMFPFLDTENVLYFSSDGFMNLGLLDIFKINMQEGTNAKVENLGAPFNSGQDDFAYYINTKEGTGFFSSNRANGKGGDDIYSFSIRPCKQYIRGIVRDKDTNEPLVQASVELIDETGKVIIKVTTDDDGEYLLEVDCDKQYTIRGTKPDYKDDIKEVTTTGVTDLEIPTDLFLTPLIKGSEIVINPIFFDFDKWDIREDAAYELENIVAVMREHPKMVIKIESHTDSRGRDRYNMKLSDRRAKSTRDYLYSRGIANDRIESAIGYGESQLVNKCSNGVKCSKEEHQANRRSKFIILNEYN